LVRGNKLPPLAAEEGAVVRAADMLGRQTIMPSKVWDHYYWGTSELQRGFLAGYRAGIAARGEGSFDVPVADKFESFVKEGEYGEY